MQSLQNLIRKHSGNHYDVLSEQNISPILRSLQLVASGSVLLGNIFRVQNICLKVLFCLSALPLLVIGLDGLAFVTYPEWLYKCWRFFAGDNASNMASAFYNYVLLFVKWVSVTVKIAIILIAAFSLIFGSWSFFSVLSTLLLMAWALTCLLFDCKLEEMNAAQKDCIYMLVSSLTLLISVLFFGFSAVPLAPIAHRF